MMSNIKLSCIIAFALLSVTTTNSASAIEKERTYTRQQQQIIDSMAEREQQYRAYGDSAPIERDVKSRARAAYGSWSWRDGVICVTDDGVQASSFVNSWHAAIVAPQQYYSVAEAPGVGKKVKFTAGMWVKKNKRVWQVGVKRTSVKQDWNAGWWTGNQKGKPYNSNFWNMKQTKSFYCSQLVWAAYYYTAGVDLDKTDNNLGPAWAIHPGELVDNKETAILYRNR